MTLKQGVSNLDVRRLIEVGVCEGEEVTKMSLVTLDSCAYTSELWNIHKSPEQVFDDNIAGLCRCISEF